MDTTEIKKEHILTVAARVYLWGVLLGLPLILHDGYFDITETKTVWFAAWSVLFLLFRGAMALQYGARPLRLGIGEWAALALGTIVLLSSAMSGMFRDSVLGSYGRWQGAGMFWLYIALYLFFPGDRVRERDVAAPLTAGLVLTGTLAILDHLGWEVLGLSAGLIDFDRGRYTSTLGNINFAGAYLSLCIPVVLWYLLHGKKPLHCLGWGAAALVGLWSAMAVRSECTILGVGTALVLMPFLLKEDAAALRRWGLLWPGLAAGMQLYGWIARGRGAYLSALTRLLLSPAVSAAVALAGGLVWLLLRKRKGVAVRKAVRFYGLLLILAALLGGAGLALVNTAWKTLPLGELESWLRFSPAWGTDRGRIWIYCLELYRDFPWPDKLLGGGCGILAWMDASRRIFPDAILDAAHSEYLQILLNWGILGLAAYLGWLVCTARDVLRRREPLSLALLAGLIGYAVQAAVNIAQAPGICLFFLLLAIARRKTVSGGH